MPMNCETQKVSVVPLERSFRVPHQFRCQKIDDLNWNFIFASYRFDWWRLHVVFQFNGCSTRFCCKNYVIYYTFLIVSLFLAKNNGNWYENQLVTFFLWCGKPFVTIFPFSSYFLVRSVEKYTKNHILLL